MKKVEAIVSESKETKKLSSFKRKLRKLERELSNKKDDLEEKLEEKLVDVVEGQVSLKEYLDYLCELKAVEETQELLVELKNNYL